jgi:predicted dinucleotide-binding enzyme
MAYLARQFPEVEFIKAFNTIGFNIMEDPLFGSIRADGYFAGDDEQGLKLVELLITDLGFDPIHVGAVQMATNLEALAWLWITQSRTRGREIAFKLLSR